MTNNFKSLAPKTIVLVLFRCMTLCLRGTTVRGSDINLCVVCIRSHMLFYTVGVWNVELKRPETWSLGNSTCCFFFAQMWHYWSRHSIFQIKSKPDYLNLRLKSAHEYKNWLDSTESFWFSIHLLGCCYLTEVWNLETLFTWEQTSSWSMTFDPGWKLARGPWVKLLKLRSRMNESFTVSLAFL